MIPFVRDFSFEYGVCERVTPLIRRVVAENPGPFTYVGTGTYLIGPDDPGARIMVIDPGPDLDVHYSAILDALRGQTLSHILVTHTHMDHSPLSHRLAEATGARIVAAGFSKSDEDHGFEAARDYSLCPDQVLSEGLSLDGSGYRLRAMATPGHTSDHFGFELVEENAFFPGDTVMGWSTSVISPPDGDMGAYMQSLEKILARGFSTLWPTHGPPISDPEPFLRAYVAHRRGREAQILEFLRQNGPSSILDMVGQLYAEVDKRLHPAAAHSLWAHALDLKDRGGLGTDEVLTIKSILYLT